MKKSFSKLSCFLNNSHVEDNYIKERMSNIDLLESIAIFFVICYHSCIYQ